jgi:hypothetical protein
MKVEDPTNAVEVLTLPSSPRKRDPALGPRFRTAFAGMTAPQRILTDG